MGYITHENVVHLFILGVPQLTVKEMQKKDISSEDRRRVLSILDEEGPISHEELAQNLGYDWIETQEVIRELRTNDMVSLTLDRRYELKESSTAPA